MKIKPFALALCCVSVGALLLPDDVLARGGRGDFHGANRANINRGNINRANFNRGNINRVGEVRDWRGNVGYGGWGWGAAATAVGAAAAGATLYNNAGYYGGYNPGYYGGNNPRYCGGYATCLWYPGSGR